MTSENNEYDTSKIEDVVIDDKGKHVTADSEIVISKPISEVYKWVVFAPLEVQLAGTKDIPGVSSTKTINDKEIGINGHRRLVCLADGNTAVEEHIFIENVTDDTSKRYFSYKVWNYSLKIAQNIEYGKGEWWFTPMGDKTHIKWRYSFKLNNKKFLGSIGFVGRTLFNIFFIKTKYNEFMIETLKKLKDDLENGGGSSN